MYVGLLLSTIKNKTRVYKYNFMIDNENLSVFLSLDYAGSSLYMQYKVITS